MMKMQSFGALASFSVLVLGVFASDVSAGEETTPYTCKFQIKNHDSGGRWDGSATSGTNAVSQCNQSLKDSYGDSKVETWCHSCEEATHAARPKPQPKRSFECTGNFQCWDAMSKGPGTPDSTDRLDGHVVQADSVGDAQHEAGLVVTLRNKKPGKACWCGSWDLVCRPQ